MVKIGHGNNLNECIQKYRYFNYLHVSFPNLVKQTLFIDPPRCALLLHIHAPNQTFGGWHASNFLSQSKKLQQYMSSLGHWWNVPLRCGLMWVTLHKNKISNFRHLKAGNCEVHGPVYFSFNKHDSWCIANMLSVWQESCFYIIIHHFVIMVHTDPVRKFTTKHALLCESHW